MTRHSIHNLEAIVKQVRRDILRMVHGCQSGHPGGSLGCTELLVCLYFELMQRNDQFDLNGLGEDLFFLSNGHISPVFYSVLARAGYFPIDELATFRNSIQDCRDIRLRMKDCQVSVSLRDPWGKVFLSLLVLLKPKN